MSLLYCSFLSKDISLDKITEEMALIFNSYFIFGTFIFGAC